MPAAQPTGGADAEQIAVFREGIGLTNLGGRRFHAKPDDPSILIINGGPYPRPQLVRVDVGGSGALFEDGRDFDRTL
jgi:hypothetical protein